MPEADRLRLAARVQADYAGYAYAPILADDMRAAAGLALDVSVAGSLAAQVALDRTATSSSASAAAASVPATADRTVGRRLNDVAIWGMLRSTPAWGFGVDGTFTETAIDTLRWEFDPATLAPFGASFAGARTNQVRNPRMEGAAAGTPGTVPTNWAITNAVGGINRRIVGLSMEAGLPVLDIEFTCTAVGAGFGFLVLDTGTSYAVGDVVSVGAWVRLISGTPPSSLRWLVQTGGADQFSSAFSLTGTLSRQVAPITIPVSGSLARANLENRQAGFTGVFVLRIGGASTELGAFASSPIFAPVGTPTTTTRAQGNVTIPVVQLGTRWNRRQGILIVDWNSQPGAFASAAAADWMGLISWGDSTANERLGILINPAHTSLEARVTAAGVAGSASVATISAPLAGATTRAAVAWDLDAGFLQVAGRGAAGSKVALTALPIPGNIMPGRFATSHPLFGRIAGAELRPAALFDSALAALT